MGALNVTVTPWLVDQNTILNDILLALGGPTGANAYDSLGRLLVSNPRTVFEAEFTYDEQPNLFEKLELTVNPGGVSQDFADRTLRINSNAKDPSHTVIRSFQHIPYQQSKPQVSYFSVLFKGMPATATVNKYFGMYDGTTGIRIGATNGSYYTEWKSGGTAFADVLVPQASWNLDTLDGLGPSALTLDPLGDKQYCFVIDFQAVQLGKVRCGVFIGEELVWFHQYTSATNVTDNAMAYLTLPVTMGIEDTVGTDDIMELVNCAVLQEGGNIYDEGYNITFSTSLTAVNGVEKHAVSLGRSEFFNGLDNYATLVLSDIEIMVLGADPVKWRLRYKAELDGTGVVTDLATDAARLVTGATAFTNTGFEVMSGFAASGDRNRSSYATKANMAQLYPITLDDLQNYHLTIEGIGGAPVVHIALNWREIR